MCPGVAECMALDEEEVIGGSRELVLAPCIEPGGVGQEGAAERGNVRVVPVADHVGRLAMVRCEGVAPAGHFRGKRPAQVRADDAAPWFHQVARAGHDRDLKGEIEREQRPHEFPRLVVVHGDRDAPQRAAEQAEFVHFVQSARCE